MDGHACKRYIFRSYNTSTLNAVRFDENPFTCQAKKAEGSQSSNFHWSFLNGSQGVNVLIPVLVPTLLQALTEGVLRAQGGGGARQMQHNRLIVIGWLMIWTVNLVS